MLRYVLTIFFGVTVLSSFGQIVSTQSELDQALSSATAGDEIILKDQVWADVIIDIDGTGTFAEPIIIRGETAGLTILEGNVDINLGGEYVIFRDVIIRNAYGLVASGSRIDHLIEFEAASGNECNNCTITNIKIDRYNGTEAQAENVFKWIYVLGKNNEISYSSFVGKYGVGSIINDNRSNGEVNFIKIHHNYFADRTPVGALNELNDQDAIRIGSSSTSMSDSFSEVYDNYFYNFFGEIEIISNKSGSNQYYNNTFRKYSGTLTLRHGNNCKVFNNYFFAEKNFYSGGVRVIGEGHEIYNNYIEGVNSKKESGSNSSATGGINITNGRPDSELNGYFQVKNAKIINNTFVDCDYGLRVGTKVKSDLTLAPENIDLSNNIMLNSSTSAFSETTAPINSTYSGNITQNGSWDIVTGSDGNIEVESGLLEEGEGFYRIKQESAAIDAGLGTYEFLNHDILGAERPVDFDAGAEEYNAGGSKLPYTAEDVGEKIGFGALTGDLPDDLAVSTALIDMTYESGTSSVFILSNVEWEVISDANWLTVDPASGSGSEEVIISVTENESLALREGKLLVQQIGGSLQAEVTVKQSFNKFSLIEGEKIPIVSVTGIGTQQPNIPENTLDNNAETRWSAESNDGSALITYYLWKLYDIEAIRIMFHKGDERSFEFKLISNIDVISDSTGLFTSSGLTNEFETFLVEPDLMEVEYLTIAGYGNTDSDWNSYVEVEIYGSPTPITALDIEPNHGLKLYPNPTNNGIINVEQKLPIGKVLVTTSSGKVIYNGQTSKSELKINLEGIERGLYILTTESGGKMKFIVE